MRRKQPTITYLVETMLRKTDDFMNHRMLMKETGAGYNQVHAACHHLRNRHVIDCIIDPSGKGWWYALPKEEDNRIKHYEERVPESKPRKKRREKSKTK